MSKPEQNTSKPETELLQSNQMKEKEVVVETTQKPNKYCMMIVSKYFNTIFDFINLEKCCKEYRGITEQFHFNPIPLQSNKTRELFKNVETFWFYTNPFVPREGKPDEIPLLKRMMEDKRIKKINIVGDIEYEEVQKTLKEQDIPYIGIDDQYLEFKDLTTPYRTDGYNPDIHIMDGFCKKYTNYQGDSPLNDIVIPTSITRLSNQCFHYTPNGYLNADVHRPISSVVIPTSVSEIGTSCFTGCENLSEITIPSSINYLKNNTFYDCAILTKIELPDTVYNIGSHVFDGCSSLESINLPSKLTELGSSSFYNCKNLLEINIPSTISTLKSNCFQHCSRLSSITIPTSITSIEEHVFNSCVNLSKITLPNSIEILPDYLFFECEKLKQIGLPSKIISIGMHCFNKCSSLKELNLRQYTDLEYINISLFEECTSLTNIQLPSTIQSIDSRAFAKCSSLREITIPSTVSRMGRDSFEDTNVKIYFKQGCPLIGIFTKSGNYIPPSKRKSPSDLKFTKLFK